MAAMNEKLNEWIDNLFRPRVERSVANSRNVQYQEMQRVAALQYRINYLDDALTFKGEVVYRYGASESRLDIAHAALATCGQVATSLDALTAQEAEKYVRVRVRIPELHAGIPEPCFTDTADEANRAKIEMHPLFVSAETMLMSEAPNPGDIVYVSFERGPNNGVQAGGIYHGLYKRGPGTAENSSPSACQSLQQTMDNRSGVQRLGVPAAAPPRPFLYASEEVQVRARNYDSADIPNKAQHTAVLNGLHPDFANVAKAFIYEAWGEGVTVQLNSGYRSPEEQQSLIDRFERGEAGIYRPAAPGSSHHQLGMAIDLNPTLANGTTLTGASSVDQWGPVRTIAESVGLYWGGHFRNYDPIHFDFRNVGPSTSAERIAFFRAAEEAGNPPNRHPLSRGGSAS